MTKKDYSGNIRANRQREKELMRVQAALEHSHSSMPESTAPDEINAEADNDQYTEIQDPAIAALQNYREAPNGR